MALRLVLVSASVLVLIAVVACMICFNDKISVDVSGRFACAGAILAILIRILMLMGVRVRRSYVDGARPLADEPLPFPATCAAEPDEVISELLGATSWRASPPHSQ